VSNPVGETFCNGDSRGKQGRHIDGHFNLAGNGDKEREQDRGCIGEHERVRDRDGERERVHDHDGELEQVRDRDGEFERVRDRDGESPESFFFFFGEISDVDLLLDFLSFSLNHFWSTSSKSGCSGVQMTGSSEFFFRFDPFETGFCCLVDSFSS
jgi:hypothetical protein